MSIRPIDVVKTQDAAQIKHIENQRNQQAHDQFEKSFQTMVKNDMQKTTQATKSDNKEYRYDAKEKGNNQYKGSNEKKKNSDKEEKNKSKETDHKGGIDILI
jgi:hypothetical protein